VVRIDAARNAVIVGAAKTLSLEQVTLAESVWRLPESARVLAQVRYRGHPLTATATPDESGLSVQFDTPTDGLAPGQSLVLYQGDRVVGGGVVPASALRS
jgi:tRNA-specific 2-thiouridylase